MFLLHAWLRKCLGLGCRGSSRNAGHPQGISTTDLTGKAMGYSAEALAKLIGQPRCPKSSPALSTFQLSFTVPSSPKGRLPSKGQIPCPMRSKSLWRGLDFSGHPRAFLPSTISEASPPPSGWGMGSWAALHWFPSGQRLLLLRRCQEAPTRHLPAVVTIPTVPICLLHGLLLSQLFYKQLPHLAGPLS